MEPIAAEAPRRRRRGGGGERTRPGGVRPGGGHESARRNRWWMSATPAEAPRTSREPTDRASEIPQHLHLAAVAIGSLGRPGDRSPFCLAPSAPSGKTYPTGRGPPVARDLSTCSSRRPDVHPRTSPGCGRPVDGRCGRSPSEGPDQRNQSAPDPVTRRTCPRPPARARCDRRGGRGAREPGGARWPPGPAPPVRVARFGTGQAEGPAMGTSAGPSSGARLGVPGRAQQATTLRRDDATAFREGSVKEPSGRAESGPARAIRPASCPRRCPASRGGARRTP